jgi:cobyrinic acid a,c-diamide synthase
MQGMPVYAECGGLMYLTRQIVDFTGKSFDMVGVIPAICTMESTLQTVGYVEATALGNNILCSAGDILRGHEFHFSRMIADAGEENFPWAFQIKKVRTGAMYPGGYASGNVLGSYLHLHFAGNEQAATCFIQQCRNFQQNNYPQKTTL